MGPQNPECDPGSGPSRPECFSAGTVRWVPLVCGNMFTCVLNPFWAAPSSAGTRQDLVLLVLYMVGWQLELSNG